MAVTAPGTRASRPHQVNTHEESAGETSALPGRAEQVPPDVPHPSRPFRLDCGRRTMNREGSRQPSTAKAAWLLPMVLGLLGA